MTKKGTSSFLLLPLLPLLLSAILFAGFVSVRARATETGDEEEEQRPSPGILLRDGTTMPRVGLGVALTAERTHEAVSHAIRLGYRLVDTAAEESYGNEDQVGRALTDHYGSLSEPSETAEKEAAAAVFVTTKLWDADHGFHGTLRAFFGSYRRLNGFSAAGGETGGESGDGDGNGNSSIPIDLYLVHSPYGGRLVETWDALLWLREHHGDKLRSIGVSNFGIDHLEVLREAGRPMPAVNQIEMHPLVYAQRRDLLAYCRRHGIAVQAFGSLMHGYPRFLENPPPVLSEMVERHNDADGSKKYAVYHGSDPTDDDENESDDAPGAVTVVHVLLQWALQHGFAIIPKSSRTRRITENVRYIDLTGGGGVRREASSDFRLTDRDMEVLDRWGDHVPYEDRNIYKEDWNWNPIDEAPLHSGETHHWPGYESLRGEESSDLEDLIERIPEPPDEDGYWEEYWENAIPLDEDDDDDYDRINLHEEL